ncbi:uro-adherence factor A-like [Argopecten irradians]|uniref:uro-adherence factor A-like n=1 Tax=Argopecten irradians TaxID=31199 RepID=UPI003723C4C2
MEDAMYDSDNDLQMESSGDNLTSLDLYDDLITDEGLTRQDNYDELSRKYDAAVLKNQELESEVATLRKTESSLTERCTVLEKNISTLFLTARLELQRKDKVIQYYKQMKTPRNQTAYGTKVVRQSRWEQPGTNNDQESVSEDKGRTKRRLSSDDQEEKDKKKRKVSDKAGNNRQENVPRTENCRQNAARKILEKSKRDIQRRASVERSLMPPRDKIIGKTDREKNRRSRKDSGNESRKSDKNDSREKKSQTTEENETRGEGKRKDKLGETNKRKDPENGDKKSGSVCDLREKLRLKRLRDNNINKNQSLDYRNYGTSTSNYSKVCSETDERSLSSSERTKPLEEFSSPKSGSRNRLAETSSPNHAKSDSKERENNLQRTADFLSPVSKCRSNYEKQVTPKRKSVLEKVSNKDSNRKDSQSGSKHEDKCHSVNMKESRLPETSVVNSIEKEPLSKKSLSSSSRSETSSTPKKFQQEQPLSSEADNLSSVSSEKMEDGKHSTTGTMSDEPSHKDVAVGKKVNLSDRDGQQKVRSDQSPRSSSNLDKDDSVVSKIGSSDEGGMNKAESCVSVSKLLKDSESNDIKNLLISQESDQVKNKSTAISTHGQTDALDKLGETTQSSGKESRSRTRHQSKGKSAEKQRGTQEPSNKMRNDEVKTDVKQLESSRKTYKSGADSQTSREVIEDEQQDREFGKTPPGMDINDKTGNIKPDQEKNEKKQQKKMFDSSNDNDKKNRNCTGDIRKLKKNTPLSPRNVEQSSAKLKDDDKVKTGSILLSPVGKSRASPRRSKDKHMRIDSGASNAPSKHRKLSEVNQSDIKMPPESISQINVSPGSKENAGVTVGFVCEQLDNPVLVSKDDRLALRQTSFEDIHSIMDTDPTDIQSNISTAEKVHGIQNNMSENNKKCETHRIDKQDKKESIGDNIIDSESQRLEKHETKSRKSEKQGQVKIDSRSKGNGKSNDKSQKKEKIHQETHQKEKLYPKTHKKEKVQPETHRKEKLHSVSQGKERISSENSDEVKKMKKIDTKSKKTEKIVPQEKEKLDSKSQGMEEINYESQGMGMLNITEMEKLDSETQEMGTIDSHVMDKMESEEIKIQNLESQPMENSENVLQNNVITVIELQKTQKLDSQTQDIEKHSTEVQETERLEYPESLDIEEMSQEMEIQQTKPNTTEKRKAESEVIQKPDSEPSKIDQLNTKLQEKDIVVPESPDTLQGMAELTETDNQNAGSEEMVKLDTDPHRPQKLDGESMETEKLDTESEIPEKSNNVSVKVEKLNCQPQKKVTPASEPQGNEKLDNESMMTEKPDTELREMQEAYSENVDNESKEETHKSETADSESLDQLKTVSQRTEKVSLEVLGKEELDNEPIVIEKPEEIDLQETKETGFESQGVENNSQRTKQLDINICDVQRQNTSARVMDTSSSELVNIETEKKDEFVDEENRKEFKTEFKSPVNQKLIVKDSAKENLANDMSETEDSGNDSTMNRKTSSSSVSSDSTLESDLEMSSDSESEELSDAINSHSSGEEHQNEVSEPKNTPNLKSAENICSSDLEPKIKTGEQHTAGENSTKALSNKDSGYQQGPEVLKAKVSNIRTDESSEELDYEFESDSSSSLSPMHESSGNESGPETVMEEDVMEDVSNLDNRAEGKQEDALMLCVSPSESMEFDTEEDDTGATVQGKKTSSPRKKVSNNKSKRDEGRKSISKQGDSSENLTNDSKRDDRRTSKRDGEYHFNKTKDESCRNDDNKVRHSSHQKHGDVKTSRQKCEHNDRKDISSRDRKRASKERDRKRTSTRCHSDMENHSRETNCYGNKERKSKDRYTDTRTSRDSPRTSKDRHSDKDRTVKDCHSDKERAVKDRHSDKERTVKDCHRDTKRSLDDHRVDKKRISDDHSDKERKSKERQRDVERKPKDLGSRENRLSKNNIIGREKKLDHHQVRERPSKEFLSGTERISKDPHSHGEGISKDRHSDTEKTSNDCHVDTEKTSKDCHSDSERSSGNCHVDTGRSENHKSNTEMKTEECQKPTEQTFKSRHGHTERPSNDYHSNEKKLLSTTETTYMNDLYDTGKTIKDDQGKKGCLSKIHQKQQKSSGKERSISSKHRKTSETKASQETVGNLQQNYESTKVLRTVTSETIFSTECSHAVMDTKELYDHKTDVDNLLSQNGHTLPTGHTDLPASENITICHPDPQAPSNITICHTDPDSSTPDLCKNQHGTHPVFANRWPTLVGDNSQNTIVNITHTESDDEDIEIRVTDSSNNSSDDFLSDVSEPEKCARVRTWQEVAKIFRENVDIVDVEAVEMEQDVEERSGDETSASESSSDEEDEESDDSCYAMDSNYTFELCKSHDTLSEREDEHGTNVDRETVCVENPDKCLPCSPEICDDNANDNFMDSLDDRFHNCPVNIPKACVLSEVSLEEGEILSDSEERLDSIPNDKKSSRCENNSSGSTVNKKDKHFIIPKCNQDHHSNRTDKQSSGRSRISPRPSPRKGKSPRDEMYRRKHLQTAVKVLRNRSRERKSNSLSSPVKVPRADSSRKKEKTDLRNRIGDKTCDSPRSRLHIRKRKRSRSRSIERGSKIKHVSPRRS